MNEDPGGKSGEVLFEFRQVGAQMRVAAIDVGTGTEVVVIAPATATQIQMKSLALGKLRAKMAGGPDRTDPPPPPVIRGKYA